jgi:molybdopterin-guanine dinucleotide biosynthesis protein A
MIPGSHSAVILAGGKSSRMGRSKALLEFAGEPLIVHLVRELKKLFDDVVVVAAPEQELPLLPVTVARDEVAYQGPVGGIYYGMKAARGDTCFVTSCDVAFLNTALIAHLMSQISHHDVVVPYWEERFQPLHAVYRRGVLPLLAGQLERGELRPVYLFDKVRTLKIGADEVRRFDPEGLSFFNMNTPADYDAALARWPQWRNSGHAPAGVAVTCCVELFGAARLLAQTKEIALSLPEGATIAQAYAALADKLPVLLERVITADRSALVRGYACNVNGLEFNRAPSAKIRPGDKIFILSADAGG